MHVLNKRHLFARLLREQAAGDIPPAGDSAAATPLDPAGAGAVAATAIAGDEIFYRGAGAGAGDSGG